MNDVHDIREKLAGLEQRSRELEPASPVRKAWLASVQEYGDRFLDALPSMPVYQVPTGKQPELGIAETPGNIDELLAVQGSQVDRDGINPASGGHMGYIPGGGVYPSALGDYLADVSNRYSGVSFASPAAASVEHSLIRWMAELVGYPASAGGDLTSGGSTANLAAIVAARDSKSVSAGEINHACIYLTRQVHHCVEKALRIAGLGEARLRFVPMDAVHRMMPTELDGMVRSDRAHGLNPFLVVASAGTTDTGAVDPLVEISAIARNHGLWFHVDAAYGGFFMLCEEGRAVLQGMGLADSLVMDPHKGLFLPYGSGALLVREVQPLARAHAYHADYMQDATRPDESFSPADLSAELSRPFRGMRLWLPLKLFGVAPFRAALAEKIWLARYFHQRLGAMDNWEVGPSPDLSVVTYRYLPREGDPDDINRAILKAVHADGRVFITSTLLDGRYTLRLAVLNFRTHLEHVDYLLDLLDRTARKLDQSSPSQ